MKTWIKKMTAMILFCTAAAFVDAKPLNVVATTVEMGALASAIGGAAVKVRTITTGVEDPHFMDARPTFFVIARHADLWIRNGMDLEIGWEPIILDRCRNPRIRIGQKGHFDGGNHLAYVLEIPDASITRAMGDVHPQGNPHYMPDPLNARALSMALAKKMIALSPGNKELFEAGLSAFLMRLDAAMFGEALVGQVGADRLWQAERSGRLDDLLVEMNLQDKLGGWKAQMAPWKGKPVITFHKSFSYFAHRFGLQVVSNLEPVPGIPPTPAHLARVLEIANAQDVRLILKETWYPERPAQFITASSKAEMKVVRLHPTEASADGYFKWMNGLVAAFNQK